MVSLGTPERLVSATVLGHTALAQASAAADCAPASPPCIRYQSVPNLYGLSPTEVSPLDRGNGQSCRTPGVSR